MTSKPTINQLKRRMFLGAFTILALGFTACTSPNNAPSANQPPAQNPADNTGSSGGVNASLSGAGASFPAPLYQRWFSEYNKKQPGVQISYQSVGSGAGVEQFLNGTVDFGASDAPLSAKERQQFQQKYGSAPIQVPMTGGAVVIAYNLPGTDNLKISRDAFCGMVEGKITSWNDPKIAQANSGVTLPARPIQFVHRSDGSGTTFIFTNHIKAACPDWQAGAGKSVEWPIGTGAKGNEGITAQVQQTEGAVGYVEYAYAHENNLKMASLENKAGKYIVPSPDSAAVVFDKVEIPEDFAVTVPDPQGDQAYPIAGLTWLLLYPQYQDAKKAEALKGVIEWAQTSGQQYAKDLGYLPLPQSLKQRVVDTVKGQVKTR